MSYIICGMSYVVCYEKIAGRDQKPALSGRIYKTAKMKYLYE